MKIKGKLITSFLLISLVPVFLIIFFIYFNVSDTLLSQALVAEEHGVMMSKENINNFLSDCKANVIYLSSLSSLDKLINAETTNELLDGKKLVSRDFLSFAQQNLDYYQIRYIDQNGNEIVRVNNIGEGSILISDIDLQNKKNRYYFIDAMKMSRGEVFVSPLDLNKERGEIENRGTERNPKYIPVIRYATPVFSKNGESRGVVILNIYADEFLSKLREINNDDNVHKKVILINDKGYFLSHPDRNKEWGFMLGNDETVAKYYKDSALLLHQTDDQFFDENSNSFFTFSRIYPGEKSVLKFGDNIKQDKFWVIISQVNKNDISKSINLLLIQSLLLILLIAGLILVVAIIFSRIIFKPIKKLGEGIKVIKNGNLDYKVKVKSKDEFGELAKDFNSMAKSLKTFRDGIEEKVEKRTKQLQDLNNHMIGREIKMMELKKELNRKSK